MSAQVLRLDPKQTVRQEDNLLTDTVMALRLYLVDQAQIRVNECWDRVLMTTDSEGESDQMAILDYEMALNDLLEANVIAGMIDG